MKSRKYDRIVEVWKSIDDYDGYSGDITADPIKLSNSWCNIKTVSSQKLTELGLSDYTTGILINLRHRKDLDYYQEGIFIRYKEEDFIIQSIEEKDLSELEIIILAVK